MAEVNKRTTETKFVTLLADARPDVDITFRDPVLTRPTDHYLVGVDNLTLCSSGFSMIEPREDRNHTHLIRIVRKPLPMIDIYYGSSAQMPAGTDTVQESLYDGGYSYGDIVESVADIASDEIITCVQQLLERLNRMAAIVNAVMNNGQLQETSFGGPNGPQLDGYTPAPNEDLEHLKFRISRDGRLIIEATNAFWACFAIEVPSLQNQYGFYGPELTRTGPFYSQTGRRYLTVDQHTGMYSFGNMVTIRKKPYSNTPPLITAQQGLATADVLLQTAQQQLQTAQQLLAVEADPVAAAAFQTVIDQLIVEVTALQANAAAAQVVLNHATWNQVALTEGTPHVLTVVEVFDSTGTSMFLNTPSDAQTHASFLNGTLVAATYKNVLLCDGNMLSALDRRVALELGTSLPVKNSPMVDHQKETPDFVLARWMMTPGHIIVTNDQGQLPTHSTAISTTREYQRASDRITYHELMPQQKLQVLRVRLYARIRKFDETSETWSMRVIELPTTSTDWWHARIHFVSKD